MSDEYEYKDSVARAREQEQPFPDDGDELGTHPAQRRTTTTNERWFHHARDLPEEYDEDFQYHHSELKHTIESTNDNNHEVIYADQLVSLERMV